MPEPGKMRAARNAKATRARILDAARQVFAAHGFANSGIRQIATAAGISPSLVMQYFQNKELLFEEALANSMNMDAMLSAIPENFGENLIAILTEEATDTIQSTAMVSLSIADPKAREVAARLLGKLVVVPLAESLEGKHVLGRAELIIMLALGYTALETLVPVGSPDPAERAFVRRFLTQTLQDLADYRAA